MEEMLAERRALGLARDELSVEASSDRSGRKEDAEFRLQKDGWLLISRFFRKKAWDTGSWTREVDDAVMARSRC